MRWMALAFITFEQADVASAEGLWKEARPHCQKCPKAMSHGRGASSTCREPRHAPEATYAGRPLIFDQALDAARRIEPEDASLTNGTLGNQALVLQDPGRLTSLKLDIDSS